MTEPVKKLSQYLSKTTNFNRVLSKVKVVSLDNGKCVAELKVDQDHANALGGLHGGMSATLVDSISTYALNCHRRMINENVKSVSVSLNIEFIKAAKIGDEIQIIANTLRAGRTLAFLEVCIKNKISGDDIVKGTHVKFCFPSDEKVEHYKIG